MVPTRWGLEAGKSFKQAALRELREETGIDGEVLSPEVWRGRPLIWCWGPCRMWCWVGTVGRGAGGVSGSAGWIVSGAWGRGVRRR